MRIDLFRGGKRPFPARIALEIFKLRAGIYAGPQVALTYRPDLLTKDVRDYVLRGMHGSGGWSSQRLFPLQHDQSLGRCI